MNPFNRTFTDLVKSEFDGNNRDFIRAIAEAGKKPPSPSTVGSWKKSAMPTIPQLLSCRDAFPRAKWLQLLKSFLDSQIAPEDRNFLEVVIHQNRIKEDSPTRDAETVIRSWPDEYQKSIRYLIDLMDRDQQAMEAIHLYVRTMRGQIVKGKLVDPG